LLLSDTDRPAHTEGVRERGAEGKYIGVRGMKWQGTGENCNEELRSFYSLPNFITVYSRRMAWAGHVACIGEIVKASKIFVRMPQPSRPLRRPRRGREDNIKMVLIVIIFAV
jgi:hypothetical protein